MPNATHMKPALDAYARRPVRLSDRAIGLSLVAIVPAMFWTVLVAIAGLLLNHPLSPAALAMTAAAIAGFLLIIASGLMIGE